MALIRYQLILSLCLFFNIQFYCQIDKHEYLLKKSCTAEVIKKDHCVLIDSALSKYRFFFIGEVHDVSDNAEIEFDLLSYLIRSGHIKILALEMPYSYQKEFDQLLKNGNDSFLRSIGKSDKEFYNKLLLLNKSLPDSSRFVVKCIDSEIPYTNGLYRLGDLIPADAVMPNAIAQSIRKIKKIHTSIFQNGNKKVVYNLYNNFINYREVYHNFLGDNYEPFYRILLGIKVDADFNGIYNDDGLKEREKFLYENLKKVADESPNDKIAIVAGRMHCIIDSNANVGKYFPNWTSMTAMINRGPPPFAINQACSFVFYYSGNRYENQNNIADIIKRDIDFPFPEQCSNFTLYRVAGKDSPFSSLDKLFQYLIVINK